MFKLEEDFDIPDQNDTTPEHSDNDEFSEDSDVENNNRKFSNPINITYTKTNAPEDIEDTENNALIGSPLERKFSISQIYRNELRASQEDVYLSGDQDYSTDQ